MTDFSAPKDTGGDAHPVDPSEIGQSECGNIDSLGSMSIVGGNWNSDVLSAGGHLLQSWEWGALKERHGWSPRRVEARTDDGAAYAQVLLRRQGPFALAYVPRGPVMRAEASRAELFDRLITVLDDLCRVERALILILEPDAPLGLSGTYRSAGFARGPRTQQPSRTVKVPLVDDQRLLDQMHSKNRYNVRLAQRRGVQIERAGGDKKSVDQFYELLRDTANRNGFSIHPKSYYDDFLTLFGERALLLFGLVDRQPAAASISVRFGGEAIYMYSGSSTTHRADGAAFLLQYEAMRWARDEGCHTYDLWGIPLEDPKADESLGDGMPATKGEDWRGLYNFKVRFGGQIVTYPKPMERRYWPVVSWVARRLAVG